MKTIKKYKTGKLKGCNIRKILNGKPLLFKGNKDTGLGEFDNIEEVKKRF